MTNKSKLTVYIAPETKAIVSECCDMDNCSSMSELVEKAILFYNGYLHAKRAEYYLPRILGSILRGTLGMFGDRIGKLLFKQAVECNVANHILAADTDKLCLVGEIVERDVNTALEWFTRAAELGNQYAQYALGKLYLQGREIPQDKEKAMRWLESSAAQGNIYAQYLLFRMEEQSNPSIMLAATKLLHHASRIFRQQAAPANPKGISMDSRRRKQLLQKRLAMGHKIDDHEEPVQGQTMQRT